MPALVGWLVGLFGGRAGVIGAVIVAVLTAFVSLMGARLYDTYIDDPRVVRDATRDMVAKVELEAEKAKLAEALRQLDVARMALDDFKAKVAVDEQSYADAISDLEAELERYADELEKAGRACRLDDGDIGWLLKP
jgi:hypothetical protein